MENSDNTIVPFANSINSDFKKVEISHHAENTVWCGLPNGHEDFREIVLTLTDDSLFMESQRQWFTVRLADTVIFQFPQ